MDRISEQDIQAIRAKAKIEEVIGDYIPVRRSGRSYEAVCPFHDDHDPSLKISAEKQIFSCFVCHTGGNVFTFVQKYKNISFPEAVREVAGLVGYSLPESTEKPQRKVNPRFERVYEVLNTVILYSQYQLADPQNEFVVKYLEARNIKKEQIDRYQFGYLPDRELSVFLQKKGFTDQEIIRSGMALMSERGLNDLFVSRLTIPIHDEFGNPVGFTARTMIGDERKYINTGQTEVYTKGNIVFNLHRAREAIRQNRYAIITEGPMDAMAMERAGYPNTVATLGTAVTKEQLQLLKRYTSKVIFCYDGDKPGQNANYKGMLLAYQIGLQVQVARNDTALDPDELDRQYGPDANRRMIDQALGWLDFAASYLKDLYQQDTYDGLKGYGQAMMKVIRMSRDPYEQQFFTRQLAENTGLPLAQLQSFAGDAPVPAENRKQPVKAQPVRKREVSGSRKAQYEVINQVLRSPDALAYMKTHDDPGYLPDLDLDNLLKYLEEYYRTHNWMDLAECLDTLPDEAMKSLLIEISEHESVFKEYSDMVLEQSLGVIRKDLLERKLKELQEDIAKETDQEKKMRLLQLFVDMKKKQTEGR